MKVIEQKGTRAAAAATPLPRSQSWLAKLAILGSAWFVVSAILLHFLQPALSPLIDAVSYYVHGRSGWLLTSGLLLLGVASVAVLVGVVRPGRRLGQGAGWWALAVWCLGVILGGVFPADPSGNWDKPPSISGLIHGTAAMVAFVAFPIAAIQLGRRFREDHSGPRGGRMAGWLGVAAVASLLAFFVSLAPVFVTNGPPKLLGLTERILLAIYTAWLVVAALGLRLPPLSSMRTD